MAVSNPLMSVVIIAGSQRERASRCLQSILGQSIVDRMEVLVMDCASPPTPPLAGSEHPNVRVFHLSPQMLYSQARAQAASLARAEIVAFIEEHCLALLGWAEALIRAHEGPWAGVGCEIHNANQGVGLSDAVELMNYAAWMPPATRGESDLLAGHNSSYKREILLKYGDRLENLLRSEPVFQWVLCRDGYRLFVEPDAKIAHTNETTLGSMGTGYYLWNRCFAPTRAEAFNWSAAKRVAWVALTPLIPFVRVFKLFVFMVRRRPRQLALFVRNTPPILAAHFSAAAGQAVGLLFGMGDAELLFAKFERDADRDMDKDGQGDD